jgi:hypothetical protein
VISVDKVTVDRSFIDAVVSSGVDSPENPPTDCRIALRWSASDSSVDWNMDLAPKDLVDGDQCDFHSISPGYRPEGQTYPDWKKTRANWTTGGRQPGESPTGIVCHSAGPGTVTVAKDGSVSFDAQGEENPSSYLVLAAVDESGNVFFWMR